MRWSEPGKWYRAARRIAKSEGGGRIPWASWIGVLALFGGLVVLEWLDADPADRVSVPKLIGAITAASGFLLFLGWIYVRLNCMTTTVILEGGIIHRSGMKKRWIPWSQIEYFYIDEGGVESRAFKFLNWRALDQTEEEFSVVPESVEISFVIRCFETNNVKQIATPCH